MLKLAAAVAVLLASTAGPVLAMARGALPGWIPIGTVDRALNAAAVDLKLEHRFVLEDCADRERFFVCSYASPTGLGVLAWGARSENLIQALTVSMPSCKADLLLAEVAAMMVHIFSPQRPHTFARPIAALARYAAASGSGEHWLDGVAYLVVDRRVHGYGLVVRRTPPLPDVGPTRSAERRIFESGTYFHPVESPCAAFQHHPPPLVVK